MAKGRRGGMFRCNQAVGNGKDKGCDTDTLSSNWSALCARDGALFYCSYGSPIITSTVPGLVILAVRTVKMKV